MPVIHLQRSILPCLHVCRPAARLQSPISHISTHPRLHACSTTIEFQSSIPLHRSSSTSLGFPQHAFRSRTPPEFHTSTSPTPATRLQSSRSPCLYTSTSTCLERASKAPDLLSPYLHVCMPAALRQTSILLCLYTPRLQRASSSIPPRHSPAARL